MRSSVPALLLLLAVTGCTTSPLSSEGAWSEPQTFTGTGPSTQIVAVPADATALDDEVSCSGTETIRWRLGEHWREQACENEVYGLENIESGLGGVAGSVELGIDVPANSYWKIILKFR